MNVDFETKLRRLMDEAIELLPKMSGAQLVLCRNHHAYLADAAASELQRRQSQ